MSPGVSKLLIRFPPAAVLLLAGGCMVGPDYAEPEARTSPEWLGAPPAAEEAYPPLADDTRWWEAFGDPKLNETVERALAANPDIRIARARLREARAVSGIARADLLPALGTSASAESVRQSEEGRFAFPDLPGGAETESEYDLYEAGFDASWEIDLFGGNRRQAEAAAARAGEAAYTLADVRLSIAAETARAYLRMRGAEARLRALRGSIEAQERTLDYARERLGLGLGTDLDRAQTEAQLAATRAEEPALAAARRVAIYTLGVLTHQQPGIIVNKLAQRRPVPVAEATLPLDRPVSILARRPDVRAAERALAAATADIGMATADLYPRLDLAGIFAWRARAVETLFESPARAWEAGPVVSLPIFQGGRLRARIRAEEAQAAAALAGFDQTVLTAVYEVEEALVQLEQARTTHERRLKAVCAAREAAELARDLFGEGLVDILPVIEANDRLAQAELALAASRADLGRQAVALNKALGGGIPLDREAAAPTAQAQSGADGNRPTPRKRTGS